MLKCFTELHTGLSFPRRCQDWLGLCVYAKIFHDYAKTNYILYFYKYLLFVVKMISSSHKNITNPKGSAQKITCIVLGSLTNWYLIFFQDHDIFLFQILKGMDYVFHLYQAYPYFIVLTQRKKNWSNWYQVFQEIGVHKIPKHSCSYENRHFLVKLQVHRIELYLFLFQILQNVFYPTP